MTNIHFLKYFSFRIKLKLIFYFIFRCYDRYGLGFFWTAYFECEPGTVFSDELDQCVFGSVNDNCKPSVPGPLRPVTYPPVVTPSYTRPPAPVCQEVIAQCVNKPVCPASASVTMYVYQVRICEVAETRCSDGRVTPKCPAGQVYGEAMKNCIDGL